MKGAEERLPSLERGRQAKAPLGRLLFVFTSPYSADRLYRGQFTYLRRAGFDIAVMCAGGPVAEGMAAREGVTLIPVSLERSISLMSDLGSVIRLGRAIRQWRPDIIVYGTPKASLVAAIASTIVRVPVRVYVLHGLRLETLTGMLRRVSWLAELLVGRLSTEIWTVSRSLRERVVTERIMPADRTVVLGEGSCNGVDVSRFNRSGEKSAKAALSLDLEAFTFLFIGRLAKDKGIVELVRAFGEIKEVVPRVQLLLVGDFDPTDPVPESTRRVISRDPDIVTFGDVPNPEDCFAAADAVVLPTYREGLPGVLLEAAAAGCAIVTTTATGARDLAADDRGLIVPVGDADGLAMAMQSVVLAPSDAARRRDKARAWVTSHFAPEVVWAAHEERLKALRSARSAANRS